MHEEHAMNVGVEPRTRISKQLSYIIDARVKAHVSDTSLIYSHHLATKSNFYFRVQTYISKLKLQ